MKSLLYDAMWLVGLLILVALATYIILPIIHIMLGYINQVMAVFPG